MATRRLPVIQEPTGDDAEAALRPAWQWVLIGSGLLVTIWTPCVALVMLIAGKVAAARAGSPPIGSSVAALLVAATFALSALAAGYLVARFGRRTQQKHRYLAGLAASFEIWVLVGLGGGFDSALLAATEFVTISALGASFCGLGGWLGRHKKSAG